MSKTSKALAKKFQIKSKSYLKLEKSKNWRNFKDQKRTLFQDNFARFGEWDQAKLSRYTIQA